MKIQEVIDEVNEAWGEEHEEKRKKIFRENIFWKPVEAFFIVSGLYFWWNGRKADRQMDFSKRSKPPELARYKELLEISKEYKELVNFENVDALVIVSPEY